MNRLLLLIGCVVLGLRVVAAPVAPGDHSFTIKVAGTDRHYTVHVPPSYDGKTPVPLVIMLHGGGGTSRGAAVETGWSIKADAAGFLAVYPDATSRDPTKPSQFARNPQLWNDNSERFYGGTNAPDDVAFLNAMLDDLLARFAVARQRIFATGFSNGASMCFRIGVELSHRFAAIAPVAGACWLEKVALTHPVSLCYLTGTADPLNPLEGACRKWPSVAAASRCELNPSHPSASPSANGPRHSALPLPRPAPPKQTVSGRYITVPVVTGQKSFSSRSKAKDTPGLAIRASCRHSWLAERRIKSTQPTSFGTSSKNIQPHVDAVTDSQVSLL